MKFIFAFLFAVHFSLNSLADEVLVPLDSSKPSGEKISLVYKILNPQDVQKPWLLFVGGGPVMPTIGAYDDWAQAYSKYFRVVLFDQRGVGQSSPITLENPPVPLEKVLEIYGSLSIAKDLKILITALQSQLGSSFVLAGHSFGGMVIYDYLSLIDVPKPNQILLFSPAPVTHKGIQTFANERLQVQVNLNRSLARARPDIKEKLVRARAKLNALVAEDTQGLLLGGELDISFHLLNPYLWGHLDSTLDAFLNPEVRTADQVIKVLGPAAFMANPLFYAFGSSWPKRKSEFNIIKDVPAYLQNQMKPWMLLEANFVMSEKVIARLPKSHQLLFAKIDQALSNQKQITNSKAVRDVAAEIPVLFLAGDTDVFVPLSLAQSDFDHLFTEGEFHHFELMEGGDHFAGKFPHVVDFVAERVKECVPFLESGQRRM